MARRWQHLRPIQVNVLTMTTIERSETTRIRGFKNTRFTDGKPADQKRQEIGQFDDSVWALLRMIDEFLPVEVRDPNIELSRFSNKKFLCYILVNEAMYVADMRIIVFLSEVV